MATLKELKGRIGSVSSSEKITGAMKMISSAKMHRAEQALRQLRPFRDQVEDIMANLLASDAPCTSPLMEARPVENIALVAWGSDDGLCGAYNVNIFKQLLARIAELRTTYGSTPHIKVLPIGKKLTAAAQKLQLAGVEVESLEGVNSKSDDQSVKSFAWRLRDLFVEGTFDRVETLYMRFFSVGRQRPETVTLLPVSPKADDEGSKAQAARPYIFEPSAEAIFNQVLPMHLLAVVADIFTENRASEQAARVMAMQAANDNAKKLRDQLQLEFNKLRQQSITNELLDILGGQVK